MIKKTIFILGFLFCVGIATIAQKAAFVSIDGNIMPIDNLLMQDSVVGGKINYISSFTMPVNTDAAGQFILNALQKGSVNVSIFYTRSVGTTTERQYNAVNTVQLQFMPLDAASKNPLKIEVKFRSLQVSEKADVKLVYKNSGARLLLNSFFSVSLDNLPTTRISGISGLELKNNVLVSFEISVTDIEAWSKHFNTQGKKINGTIALLAPNLRDKLKQIKLSGIELVSLTQSINLIADKVERFTVVAKVAAVLIEDAK